MFSPIEQQAHDLLTQAAPAKLVRHSENVHAHVRDTLHCTDTDVLATALLHDLIEDTDVTYEQLATAFTPAIADMVRELSHAKEPTKEDYVIYHNQLRTITPNAQIIKIADELCKLESYERHFAHVQNHLREEKKFTADWVKGPGLDHFQAEWERVAKLYDAE